MFFGNQHLVKDFQELAKCGRLAHGYIFFGEPEVGKFYFARHFASFLETGNFELFKKPLQDSLFWVNKKGIGDMRDLKSFLWQKPIVSSRRLAIINDADNLSPQAQNAILKIAEEPPASATLVLIAHQLETLISPLRSRLQKVFFSRLSDKEMSNFIQAAKLTIERDSRSGRRNNAVIFGAMGRPGRAVRLISDKLTEEAGECALKFLRLPIPAKSKLIKDLVERQKKTPKLLDIFFEALIIELRKNPVKNKETLKGTLYRLFLIKSYNTNKRLQLESI